MSLTLIDRLIAIPDGKEKSLESGAFLFYQGDIVQSFFVVLSGEIQLVRVQPDGASIILQRAKSGDILAEASVFSSHYHCHAIGKQTARLYTLPISLVVKHIHENLELNRMWMTHLGREMQKARFRSELLSIRTVSARLDAWLNWYEEKLPNKGEWRTLAEQLGVSKEALYREIGKRKKKYGDKRADR